MGDHERSSDPIPDRTWDWIIECRSLTPAEAVLVGDAAYDASAYREAERAYAKGGMATDPAVAARALNVQGVALWQLGQREEALKVWHEVECRHGQDPNPAVRQRVATAMRNRGVSLRDMARYEEAVQVLDEVVARYGRDTESSVLRQVAYALRNKASSLIGKAATRRRSRSTKMWNVASPAPLSPNSAPRW